MLCKAPWSKNFCFAFPKHLFISLSFGSCLLVETEVNTLQSKIGWHNYCSGSVKSLNVSILMSVILLFWMTVLLTGSCQEQFEH